MEMCSILGVYGVGCRGRVLGVDGHYPRMFADEPNRSFAGSHNYRSNSEQMVDNISLCGCTHLLIGSGDQLSDMSHLQSQTAVSVL